MYVYIYIYIYIHTYYTGFAISYTVYILAEVSSLAPLDQLDVRMHRPRVTVRLVSGIQRLMSITCCRRGDSKPAEQDDARPPSRCKFSIPKPVYAIQY